MKAYTLCTNETPQTVAEIIAICIVHGQPHSEWDTMGEAIDEGARLLTSGAIKHYTVKKN